MTVASLLLATSLKGSALLVVAWVVTRKLRGTSAAVRHLVWAGSLFGMLLVPALTGLLPTMRLKVLPPLATLSVAAPLRSPRARSSDNRLERPAAIDDGRRAAADAPTMRPPQATSPTVTEPSVLASLDFVRLAQAIWFALTAVLLLRVALGVLRVSLWTRHARSVDDGTWLSLAHRVAMRLEIARPVTLLQSERACVPMTWGVIYPTVFLPADADAWTHERRTIVLLHELAHVKRHDALTQLLAQVVVSIFWFNPLVWLAAHQMRVEREHACDDYVLAGGARATDYADDLLQIARALGRADVPVAALAMARRSELEGRLRSILDPAINHRTVSRSRLGVTALAAFALALPLAAFAPAATAPAPSGLVPPLSVATPRATSAAIASANNLARVTSVPRDSERKVSVVLPLGELGPVTIVRENSRQPAPPAALPEPRITPAGPEARRSLPDRETLIAVAQAAKKLTSDYEKAELLLSIEKYYAHDDELSEAYLDVVASMTSDFDRSRVILPLMLSDDLSPNAMAKVVKVASRMTSDNTKATLLVSAMTSQQTLTPSMRDAVIAASTSIVSDFDHGRTIAILAGRGELSNRQLIDLLASVRGMASSYEKANALVAISSHQPLADPDVRSAFMKTAETVTSSVDYRRVVTAVLK